MVAHRSALSKGPPRVRRRACPFCPVTLQELTPRRRPAFTVESPLSRKSAAEKLCLHCHGPGERMAMKRFIFNIFSLLSAASFTAIAALWIISCFRADEVHLARVEQALQWWDAKGLVIVSSAGRVGLLAFHMRVPLLPHTLKYPNPPDFEHVSAVPLRDFYFSINPATERHGFGFQIRKGSGKRVVS